jgi:hypothetical protein
VALRWYAADMPPAKPRPVPIPGRRQPPGETPVRPAVGAPYGPHEVLVDHLARTSVWKSDSFAIVAGFSRFLGGRLI